MRDNVKIRDSAAAATPKQVAFIHTLLNERDVEPKWAVSAVSDLATGLNKGRASKWINWLMDQPRLDPTMASDASEAPPSAAPKAPTTRQLNPGLYEAEGTVYAVSKSRAKRSKGATVIERVTVLPGQPPLRGFVYPDQHAAIVANAVPLSADAAGALGLVSGYCTVCNRELTNPESVKNGIGPVCAENQRALSN